MPERDWRFRFDDILTVAAHIEEDVRGLDELAFLEDRHVRQVVERNLIIVGEAVRHIPADVLAHAPDIPWGRVIAARNILVHGYMGIDHDLV